MGFFSKIGRGIKKVFKKIGRGIKKAFKGFGKFMGKIGFAGQLAMMFLFPAGIGSLFTKGLTKLGASMAAVGGPSSGLFVKAIQGVGSILNKAGKFITTVRKGFSSLTNGLKEFGKTALSKVGIKLDGYAANFFGENSAMSKTQEGFAEVGDLARGLKAGEVEVTSSTSLKDLSSKVGVTQTDLKRLNPNLESLIDKDGMLNITDGQNLMVKTDLMPKSLDPATVQKAILDEGRLDASGNLKPEFRPEAYKGKTVDPSVTSLDTVPPVELTEAQKLAQRNQAAFNNMQTSDGLTDREKALGFPDVSKSSSVNVNAEAIENTTRLPQVEGDNWFTRSRSNVGKEFNPQVKGDNWFTRGMSNVGKELNPLADGNFVTGSKNIMSVVSALTPQDDYYDDYAQPKAGVQDFHTGYAGYTPPQDFNMFNQQGGGSFGFPALQEQLNNYNMFSSQGDFMLNSQTNLRS